MTINKCMVVVALNKDLSGDDVDEAVAQQIAEAFDNVEPPAPVWSWAGPATEVLGAEAESFIDGYSIAGTPARSFEGLTFRVFERDAEVAS